MTVLPPLVYTGFWANDSDGLRLGVLPLPNQYSGRYISCWNWLMLFTLKKARLMNGKM